MKIGNTEIGERLFVAPMAEVTDYPFRYMAKKYGAGVTFTQMVSALGVVQGKFDALQYLTFNKDELPIGIQIIGYDPQVIGHSVKILSSYKPTLIDLNCGCPNPKVVNNAMGCAILDTPDTLKRIVRSMADNSNGVPISVKLRLGRDHNHISILENAKIAKDNGASLIFIHGRTKVDRYSTAANWNWIKKVKDSVDIPIVANGSVFSAEDAIKLKNETGCESVMVARGALGNPYIFNRYNSLVENNINPGHPEISLVKSDLLEHVNLIIKNYGEFIGLNHAKKHAVWYFRFFHGISSLLDTVFSVNTMEQLIELINEHADKIENNHFPEEDLEEINTKFQNKVLFWLLSESTTINPAKFI
ncbi:MAG: tRNA dihydrouridine synthase DusB [Melioribacteraceae bacterium]|nr:tRNA dihydrouridine synthase DusB [Melioribacteraceae bacterium]MCF8355844.1 tRNA dihydrouridine synthase DusB [Melioribacteraceae bacterium]MCF8392581.1 tRNA dihydrouridine synthase DusB [Melioribacteraceae bacterium]MCF8418547.1 tRNA dihydrouridine synthase DusB [Melioribacteraceae bacterium]